ncbi:MAG: AAA family ATPase, partial [Candidatus Eremiobacteraeota bacterium]|nr:AAA family ATPase [Candidatus Eremiobacteraeota bacterium]
MPYTGGAPERGKGAHMLRVRLLGRPRLAYGDASISAAARPKVVPLLAYLLLHRSAAAARRTIAGALWPEHSDDEARANLRRHLNYVQHLLPEPPAEQPWILASTADVQWNPAAPLDFDVESFERLAATAQGADAALALYEGDLLPDADEEWLAPHRERLRARFVETLAEQLSRLRAAGDRACAIAAAQRLLAADPWREDALRTLMKLRYESGDRAGALGELERFARLLRNELGVEPMPETRALGEAITRDEVPAEPVPHARAAPARHDALHVLPFCGRAYELEMLAQYARAAAGGHGALVLIGGETGIGKTRLTRELAAVAERGGAQVYSAAPGDPETIPYQPFADVLRAAAPLLTLVQLNPSPSAALGTLAPALLAYAPDAEPLPAVEPARERVRLFEACSDAWAALASRRPVVLIVEDLHRAGAGTIGLLEHLARRAGAAPILLVGTYREDDLGFSHPLRAARRRLEYDGLAHHLALPRLNADSVAELVRTLGDQGDVATVARALHAGSDGNPFYLDEMLRDLNEAGRLQLNNGRWSFDGAPPSAVPVAVREAIASRAARLSPQAAALLDVAA